MREEIEEVLANNCTSISNRSFSTMKINSVHSLVNAKVLFSLARSNLESNGVRTMDTIQTNTGHDSHMYYHQTEHGSEKYRSQILRSIMIIIMLIEHGQWRWIHYPLALTRNSFCQLDFVGEDHKYMASGMIDNIMGSKPQTHENE